MQIQAQARRQGRQLCKQQRRRLQQQQKSVVDVNTHTNLIVSDALVNLENKLEGKVAN